MRYLFRSFLGIVLCLSVAISPAGAGARARTDRAPTMAELKRQANQSAARYDKAQATLARVQNDIDRLDRQVGQLRADMAPLREAVTRRAVVLYQTERGLDALAGLAGQGDPQMSARGARIVSQASTADLAAISGLAGSASRLRDRQAALVGRRQEHEAALRQLGSERRGVEFQLAMMQRAALQSRLVENPPRHSPVRASRSSRQAAAPALVPPIDPGSIPVVTDFICPIRGPVAFSDSWGDPRSGGRRHKGTDLMSPHGTENVAVVSGTVERRQSGAGGITIYLHGDDGTTYMYMHLAEVVGPNRRVAQGELIGRTGSTGNARGGSPHTHFEIHRGGGAAVNPYPTVAAHC